MCVCVCVCACACVYSDVVVYGERGDSPKAQFSVLCPIKTINASPADCYCRNHSGVVIQGPKFG